MPVGKIDQTEACAAKKTKQLREEKANTCSG